MSPLYLSRVFPYDQTFADILNTPINTGKLFPDNIAW